MRRSPFSGKSSVVLIQSHLALPPPPMRERAPSAKVSADMEALVIRLLAKQPADRFQTPDELIAAVEDLTVKHGFNWPMPVGSMSSAPLVAPVRKSKPPPSEPGLPSVPRLPTMQHTVAALRAKLGPVVEQVRTRLWPRQTRWTRLRKSISRLQGGLPKPLRKLPLWVFAVPALLIVAGSISAAWLLSSKPASVVPSSATPAALRPPPQPEELAPQPVLDTATAQGRDALEKLASGHKVALWGLHGAQADLDREFCSVAPAA